MDWSSHKNLSHIYCDILRLWYLCQVSNWRRRNNLSEIILHSPCIKSFTNATTSYEFIHPLVCWPCWIFSRNLHIFPIILANKLRVCSFSFRLSIWNLSETLQRLKRILAVKILYELYLGFRSSLINWWLLKLLASSRSLHLT